MCGAQTIELRDTRLSRGAFKAILKFPLGCLFDSECQNVRPLAGVISPPSSHPALIQIGGETKSLSYEAAFT
jgi:hypothetical protein